MVLKYVGKDDPIMGDLDGELFDYAFLSLYERRRIKKSIQMRRKLQSSMKKLESHNLDALSPFVARYTNTLLPRPKGPPNRIAELVPTVTTTKNMEIFARSLLSSSPILLHGLAGSGKTSLVNHFACELGLESKIVTMHLNEQTDAKMLIGMYAAGSKPGSFKWRPGVLTTAVKEGRWVFIEDLDRAPNEVVSVILPLIERGELLIPSRGETIKAGRGFRLLASIRTSLSITGQEIAPAANMLGNRLWQHVPVSMPPQEEFVEIVYGKYPLLHSFLPKIIAVYNGVYQLFHTLGLVAKTSSNRPTTPRDLLKWCRRLNDMLVAAGIHKGDELISEFMEYEMFKEAVDCFAGSLPTIASRKIVISTIAQEMHIAPERVEHFMESYIPKYDETLTDLSVGRARLSKRPAGRIQGPSLKKSRPFANTTHAKRLLEQVGVAVRMSEPVLLVGETGIGKTTVVQQLADRLGYKLTAVNMSQQSEVGDLLGGFKPVNVRSLAVPLKEEFDELFSATGISVSKNQKYIDQLNKYITKSQWSKASKLWHEAPKMFEKIVSELSRKETAKQVSEIEQPYKRRKTESRLQSLLLLKPRWERFVDSLNQFDIQLSGGSKGFAFTFVEGNIVKAARNGDWVLLDEINLSSPDTLESIADLLHSEDGSRPSILLSETGEIERVYAHPNFRIFGAMNPATDVGKKDLPMGLRSRFTEIYVDSPDKSLDDLLSVIRAYVSGVNSNDERLASDVAALYMNTKRLADEKRIVDGANQVPHFSLRTLTRVLAYATEIAPSYGLRRALYEGFSMGFLTLLNRESERMLIPLISHHLLDNHGNARSLLAQAPRLPQDGRQYVRFTNKKGDRQYWMLKGEESPQEQPHYIITPSVERNILNLVRATSTRRFPILLQGPTSAGKTSMIEYLAKFSGNKFVRINNHEHTDLQEYLGTYVTGPDGQLHFQEGLLVKALRQGHWIVLDELNLCPGDVLEALNRLLDDNRELLIPETQEIVRPHENFMLFATQNPAGLYGGRKALSRAFRNRFLELHFDDIPEDELDIILEKRSQKVAPSDCRRIVQVYKELSVLRQSNRLFEQKDSFATLRDLFRWALRDADSREELAENGYMLLAERVRNLDEKKAVKEVIERVMKVKLDLDHLYDAKRSPEITAYDATENRYGIVWTRAMRRIYVLVAHALRNNEPVLLVGETGCGKTTVCQMLADAFGKELHIVNAHQNTETGDLIGAQRPVRNRNAILDQLTYDITAALEILGNRSSKGLEELTMAYENLQLSDIEKLPNDLRERINSNMHRSKSLFEWSDGSLVQAMRQGQYFLLDEISLASDSVLERMNSVLESHRTILLAEKGVDDSFIEATGGFQFFATMNPGGDYGKRELSPALRNRFTEIWVPSLSEHDDVLEIVRSKLNSQLQSFAQAMVHFAEWFGQNFRSSSSTSISVRDILAWVKFVNECDFSDPYSAVLHGAAMVYIDTLGANPSALLAINADTIQQERERCLDQLGSLLGHDMRSIYFEPIDVENTEQHIKIGGFSIKKTSEVQVDPGFAFGAPTTTLNAMRIMRGLQVSKPILVEGSPGVGKTTLVTALAKVCGKQLTRINLSEQTDLMDLFGSDIPVEGAEAGYFAWRDAPFLRAMQNGEWVLLDEINLAQQSVLEGLNACLDHRGEVYISELDQTFKRHPNFFVFAAQNPHHQGGGRKGLPSSFVNRFTVVYADILKPADMALICEHSFPEISDAMVKVLINFVTRLEQDVTIKRRFGSDGGPWEFNLRDVLRWLQLLSSPKPLFAAKTPEDFLDLIFRQRFRTPKDREAVNVVFTDVFGYEVPFRSFFHNISITAYQVGMAYMRRDDFIQRISFPAIDIRTRLPEIESVMICVEQNLPCILVGPSGSGKSTLIEHVAAAKGVSPIVFPLNADIDTMDLVG
ncbi:P-loop containing nucleoside triphosphate hydrolase protein, partial [Xylogone sp. PMI_703]